MNLAKHDYFLLFSSSFLIVSFLTPLMRRVALRYGVIDTPSESHKTHKNPIPYLGGVAIVFGVSVVSYGSYCYLIFQGQLSGWQIPFFFPH